MRNHKKYIIPLLIICLLFLVSEKYDPARKIMLTPEFNFKDSSVHNRFGDLYRLCKVDDFIEGNYYADKPKQKHSPDSAGIFLIGDSYFERPIDGKFLFNDIERHTGIKIYDPSYLYSGAADDPLGAIKKIEFSKNTERILVLETTERFSASRALELYVNAGNNIIPDYSNIKDWLYKIFINRQFYIEHSRATLPVVKLKNTFNFRVFSVIDVNIGAYSTEPPMLFYSQDVEFAMRPKTNGLYDSIANNLEALKNTLKNDYNITLLYVVIPDKYSIYNDYVNGEYKYSGYIPELVRRLTEKNIYAIDLFTAFMKRKNDDPGKILYYKSDSHFNGNGKTIFLDEVGKKIRELKTIGGK